MIGRNNLLLKTFLFSLFAHLAGISLFSLVLPIPIKEIPSVEVTLLPVSSSSEDVSVVKSRSITPEIPKISPKREKIVIEAKKEILRFSPQEKAGITRIIIPAKVISEIPELTKINIPEVPSFTGMGSSLERRVSISDVEIEGPAGDRGVIYKEPLEYPEWAIEKALEGNIRIKFWVAPDGKIVLTNIVTSSGYPELDLYAEQRFRKWVFEPVKTDQQAWGLITFRFQLK